MADVFTKPNHIFILAGQSNMSGRGGVLHRHWDAVVPPELTPNPSILRFSSSSHWELARPPLHVDIDTEKVCGVGPGIPFAASLLPRLPSGDSVGLVPCAIGGTAIEEWEKGEPLYESMVRRAISAVGGSDGGIRREIRAVLWFQGESDTVSDQKASVYRSRMEEFICNVRSDLGLSSLPFIQVALASGDRPHIEMVREAQLAIDLPNVVCVDAKGLELTDYWHLSTEAQVILGGMLADAYVMNFLSSAAH